MDRRRFALSVSSLGVAGTGLTAVGTAAHRAGAAGNVTAVWAYARSMSVVQGGSLTICASISGSAASATASVNVRRVASPADVTMFNTTITVLAQPTPTNASQVGCGWSPTYTLRIPPTWPSGYYQAVVEVGSLRSVVQFVVTPSAPGSTSAVLLQVPTTTAQAYNNWGGKSLYDFNSSGGKATSVSYDRPFAIEYNDFHRWVRPFVVWASATGRKLEFCTSHELHTGAVPLSAYQLFVTVGHDEYWSRPMRTALDRFVTGGGNAAIFSGNTCWWQIRFEPAPDGTANRIVRCHKSSTADPIADTSLDTTNWYHFGPLDGEARGTYSENATFGLSCRRGAQWTTNRPRPYTPYVMHEPTHWAFSGTGLAAGSAFSGTIVGYETDSADYTVVNGKPRPTGRDGSPSNMRILALADARSWASDGVGGTAMIASFNNNGTVFHVGTTDWTRVLGTPSTKVYRITSNVIDTLGSRKSDQARATVEIYRYHATSSTGAWRFNFSTSPFLTQKNTGWTYDEPAFVAFDRPRPGTSPIYRCRRSDASDTWYTLSVGSTAPPGWTVDALAFHAYTAAAGAGPAVHRFSAPHGDGVRRTLFSVGSTAPPGWTYDGIAFYSAPGKVQNY